MNDGRDRTGSDDGAAGARVEDVILPHAPTEDGKGVHVLRKRGESLEAGVLRGLEEGKSIHGELVRLRPRAGTPLFDVEVELDARPVGARASARPEAARGRPPKVASRAFRAGWEQIWGPAGEEPS